MEFTIDRIEGNIAVCENRQTRKTTNIEISKLPKEAKEGDIIKLENDKYIIDHEKTKEVKDKINNLFQNLSKWYV